MSDLNTPQGRIDFLSTFFTQDLPDALHKELNKFQPVSRPESLTDFVKARYLMQRFTDAMRIYAAAADAKIREAHEEMEGSSKNKDDDTLTGMTNFLARQCDFLQDKLTDVGLSKKNEQFSFSTDLNAIKNYPDKLEALHEALNAVRETFVELAGKMDENLLSETQDYFCDLNKSRYERMYESDVLNPLVALNQNLYLKPLNIKFVDEQLTASIRDYGCKVSEGGNMVVPSREDYTENCNKFDLKLLNEAELFLNTAAETVDLVNTAYKAQILPSFRRHDRPLQ